MRKTILFSGLLVLLVVAFAFTRSEIPEIDYDYELEGQPVALDFKVSKLNAGGVELALNERRSPTMFIQFGVSMEDGLRPVVTMSSLSERSRMQGRPSARSLPNFPFLKDARERPVMNFSFEQQLARDQAGNPALRIVYTGAKVPMVETLVVKEPITMPQFVSARFESKEGIQFQPGTYYLDKAINGFWIPIKILE